MTKVTLAFWVAGITFVGLVGHHPARAADAPAPTGCMEIQPIDKFSAIPGTFAIPAQLKDGTVVAPTVDGAVYFLDPTVVSKGSNAQISTGGFFGKPLELADGRILIGADDGYLYVVGRDGSATPVETRVHDGVYSGAIQLSNGDIAFSAFDQFLYVMGTDGVQKTSFPTWASILSSPVQLKDGQIVIASSDRLVYFLGYDGKTLTKKTALQTEGRFYGSPAIVDDTTVVVGGDDGVVTFISSQGLQKATFKTGGPIITSPLVLNPGPQAVVVVASQDGKIYFLDGKGAKKSEFQSYSTVFSEFDTDGKYIVFGSAEGYTYVLTADAKLVGTFHGQGAPWPGITPITGDVTPTPAPTATGDDVRALAEAGAPSLKLPHFSWDWLHKTKPAKDDLKDDAPVDRYFGRTEMSVLGIQSALIAVSQEIDMESSDDRAAHPDQYLTQTEWVDDSLRDWERQFPRDPWLPRVNFMLQHLYEKMDTQASFIKSSNAKTWIEARYPKTWFGIVAQSKLSSEKISISAMSHPMILKNGTGTNNTGLRLMVASEDHNVYLLEITDKLFPCFP